MLYIRGLDFVDEPERIRDVYLISNEDRRAKLSRIYKEARPEGLCLVITCTRIEAYTTGSPVPYEVLERAFGFNHLEAVRRRYEIVGEIECLRHLFRMSTGILSALYGEEMIVSQIGDAVRESERIGVSNSYLSRLFPSVVSFSRKERRKERIRPYDPAIGKYLASIIDEGERVLMIGSGEAARKTAGSLIEKGARVTMTLRDEEKIFLLPRGAESIAYDERKKDLSSWPVIISASSGLYHTLEKEDGKDIKARLLVDLSVPYDIPDELSPLRVKDLPIELSERKEREERIIKDVDIEIEQFLSLVDMKALVRASEDIAFDSVRRMYSVIEKLDMTPEGKEKLLDALSDSVKNSTVSWFNRNRNGKKTDSIC